MKSKLTVDAERRLRMYINSRFRFYPKTREILDVREELYSMMCDRYYDGLAADGIAQKICRVHHTDHGQRLFRKAKRQSGKLALSAPLREAPPKEGQRTAKRGEQEKQPR